MSTVQLIDYGVGNKKSLLNALAATGFSGELRTSADAIDPSLPIILPGVGSFAYCKHRLVKAGLFDFLRDLLHNGKPVRFVGICVGMQLLFGESVEDGRNAGFGYFDGTVSNLRELAAQHTDSPLRFPNTHWENVSGTERRGPFYFTHSFGNVGSSDRTAYYELSNMQVTATASRGAVTGFQFHPEKSAEQGLNLLRGTLSGDITRNKT